MLQKFSILPYAFILFLFGLTFLPVSVVAADFAACQQMNPGGNFGIMKQQKNCFRDLAKALGAKQSARAEFRACRKIKPKGKAAPMQQKIDCFMDVASSLMPNMAPPMEDPNMSPMPGTGTDLGAHCGEIQAKNEKKRMRKEVRCLRRALHEHKPTVKLRQTKDGLGAYGCGVRKTGSKPAQIACLRDLLDGPAGAPDMAAPMEDPNMPPMDGPAGAPDMAAPMEDPNMPPMTVDAPMECPGQACPETGYIDVCHIYCERGDACIYPTNPPKSEGWVPDPTGNIIIKGHRKYPRGKIVVLNRDNCSH